MNLIDTLTTPPHYFERMCLETTNENFNFDIRVSLVKLTATLF